MLHPAEAVSVKKLSPYASVSLTIHKIFADAICNSMFSKMAAYISRHSEINLYGEKIWERRAARGVRSRFRFRFERNKSLVQSLTDSRLRRNLGDLPRTMSKERSQASPCGVSVDAII